MSRVLQMPPPPPLLLTKRVTAFLRANLSPHIHSAMLTTPAGSLLAHASNLPASALRRQAAVAASLWALQAPANTAQPSPGPTGPAIPTGSTARTRRSGKPAVPAVTVQLDNGSVFVIRRLRCGMLFICMGGAEGTTGGAASHRPVPHHTRLSHTLPVRPSAADSTPQSQDETLSTATTTTTTATTTTLPTDTSPPISTPPPQHQQDQPPPPTITTTTATTPPPTTSPTPPQQTTTLPSSAPGTNPDLAVPTPPLGSPSESASIFSTHTAHTIGAASTTSTATVSGGSSVSMMRRQVEELARWLDERLGGLCVPEEGVGVGHGSGGVEGREGNGNGGVEVK
ncbi:hypothetical protein C8A05DRAFT_34024 [Staphylotrichum tortipilum]|uniref:Uncharacterized protein n=1 Tax=Staphylotrichum tortipilum TaxID=2831512 RepID=A0AAN6MLX9_9PEZI|nr:hypothetical protein C8A05DRAFT_34024 [Staphylotrichum longicolle]